MCNQLLTNHILGFLLCGKTRHWTPPPSGSNECNQLRSPDNLLFIDLGCLGCVTKVFGIHLMWSYLIYRFKSGQHIAYIMLIIAAIIGATYIPPT